MRVFSTLAELGSFTKVADAMEIGRPQVTVAIQELEAKLGIRLFQRTTRKVSLTPEGEEFFVRVNEILSSVADATTMFGRSGVALRGRLRLNIPAAFAQQNFLDALKEFSRTYPSVDLILGVTDRAVDLVAEGVDCALRIGELADSSMVARRVGTAVMVTCASPKYLEEFGIPRHVSDLSAHRGVNFLSGRSNRSLPWHFTVNGKDTTHAIRGTISVNESRAYVRSGVAGFGLIQAPGVTVDEYLSSGALVEVLADAKPSPRPVSVLYPSRNYISPQVKAFLDWVVADFDKLDPKWLKGQTT
nr:LysR family transcriptional regulator [Burkholderia sp. Ax-1719]